MTKNILALIPARGGSKGIPRKNIMPIAGKPLIAYSILSAQASRHINRIVVSTDDEEIAEVARAWGVKVPFMRPAGLAQDHTPSLPVTQHAVQWLQQHQNWHTDILLLLQPTSPLRQTHHIDQALDYLLQAQADTIVSVVKVPHRYTPYNIMQLEEGKLQDFWQDPLPFDRYRRQNLPTFYARNGPAILACKTAVLFDQKSFYGNHILPYEMPESASVDIDTPFDAQLVEWLMTRAPAAQ